MTFSFSNNKGVIILTSSRCDKLSNVVLFVCLFGVYRPIREFFSHMETSPLSVKGCKFRPMLGTYGLLSVVYQYDIFDFFPFSVAYITRDPRATSPTLEKAQNNKHICAKL